jgi:DNA mismatch repair protein MutL
MSDIIQLLPDSVANQIAAGEVVQRPASVVKELVENALDAGSTKIQVIIKDAGRTLIQVIDNGCGMSPTDARMCFERHATSKIKQANDLFNITTMGFRGEAMASIAAIATVEMRTRKADAEVGSCLVISGSVVEQQEPVSCPVGTNILVKNLFYNVPARRKFLKSNSTELRHIMDDFQHVALGFPDVEMRLVHNDVELYNLPPSKIYNRIINILGRQESQNLLPMQSTTSMANIKGYIGKPENAKKTAGDQFFFVNNRFMKHPQFYRAVLKAYENIMPQGLYPSFFIYFEVDPASIDINIHPTKTEIKFEHERDLWPILVSTVRESLGKHNVVPSIDFQREAAFDISMLGVNAPLVEPTIKVNPGYNPFTNPKPASMGNQTASAGLSASTGFELPFAPIPEQASFKTPNSPAPQMQQMQTGLSATNEQGRFFQVKGRYIVTTVKSGLMFIDQKRAHERILYDEYIYKMGAQSGIGQRLLYPYKAELNPMDATLFKAILPELNKLGFEADEFGANTFVINQVPAEFPDKDLTEWVTDILDCIKENERDFAEALRENLVRSLARFLAIPYGKTLTQAEMANLNDRLFVSQQANYAPDGKTIIAIVPIDEIDVKFK